MVVSATELKLNLGTYLKLIEKEPVIITRNGKEIARLEKINNSITDSLVGVLHGNEAPSYEVDYKEILGEMRLKDYESLD